MARLPESKAGRDKEKRMIEGRSTLYLHVRGRPTRRRFLDLQRNLRVFSLSSDGNCTVVAELRTEGLLSRSHSTWFRLELWSRQSGELLPLTQRV